MKFLLDENLSPRQAARLRVMGYDAIAAPEMGLSGASDDIVRSSAIEWNRVLVTMDADFGNIFRPSTIAGCRKKGSRPAWMSPWRSAPDPDEMMISGFIRGKPVEMVKCRTNDPEVPANARIVLEGYVEIGELHTEGPFGDHTGFYSLAGEYSVFHVKKAFAPATERSEKPLTQN